MTNYDLIRQALESERLPVMHPNGFIQLDISEAKDRSKRLHVWPVWSDVEKPDQGVFTIHSHAFGFTSNVLCGLLIDLRYSVDITFDNGDYEVWQADKDRQAPKVERMAVGRSGSPLRRTDFHAELRSPALRVYEPGQSYEMRPLDFHESYAHGLTASVMTKTLTSWRPPQVLVLSGHHPESFIERIDHDPAWMMAQIMEALSCWGALV